MISKKKLYSTVAVVAVAIVSQLAPPSWRDALSALLSPNHQSTSLQGTQQSETTDQSVDQRLIKAVANKQSKVWFDESPFTVVKLLPDDNHGSRHQRFLVARPELPTLLVAHNIDLAEYIPLQKGDQLLIRGRYEWNEKGGVIHWTHHDPKDHIQGGWIRHKAKTYR